MNSEDNGHPARPISRFSRASRESVTNGVPTQPGNTSASGPQSSPTFKTSWSSGMPPSGHPSANPPVNTRTPVFTSLSGPGYQTDLTTSPFGDSHNDQISAADPAGMAESHPHLPRHQLPKLDDEPLTFQEPQASKPSQAPSQDVESTPITPELPQRPAEETSAGLMWADSQIAQPSQSGPDSKPQAEFGAESAPKSSFAQYIPPQARELISRFSLRRDSASATKDGASESGRFALVPYIPPQARGFAALLTRLRDKVDAKAAADQASKLLQVARAESARIAAKSAQVAIKSAQKSAEGFGKARQEIAHNLRPDEIKRNYQGALGRAHSRFVDSKLDSLFFVPTQAPGRQLAVVSDGTQPSPPSSEPFDGPTPQLVFDWALATLPQDLREFVFVDFRAGRGRALLFATRRNFEKVIGYEFDEQTHDDLLMNVAQFPRSLMACRNVECLRGDQDGLSIPNEPAALFFSNAQREELLPEVLELAAASYRENPRSIYIIMFNPGPAALPSGVEEVFKPAPLALIDRLKLAALSPVKVAIYRTMP